MLILKINLFVSIWLGRAYEEGFSTYTNTPKNLTAWLDVNDAMHMSNPGWKVVLNTKGNDTSVHLSALHNFARVPHRPVCDIVP